VANTAPGALRTSTRDRNDTTAPDRSTYGAVRSVCAVPETFAPALALGPQCTVEIVARG